MRRPAYPNISLGSRPKRLKAALAMMLACLLPVELGSETLTLTSVYPSPTGVYARIVTTGGTISSPQNTLLSRDAGNVGIGTTSPSQKLDVNGQIRAAGDICTDANGGKCLGTSSAVPAGAVMFFNLAACPAGWAELAAARGRYLVGILPGSTLGAAVGTALGPAGGGLMENRPTGRHRHAAVAYVDNDTDNGIPPGVPGQIIDGAGSTAGPHISYPGAGQGHEAAAPGVEIPGTSAPYIQLLVCQKN